MWKQNIILPLRHLCETNPLFDMTDKKWLALEFDSKLAGKGILSLFS